MKRFLGFVLILSLFSCKKTSTEDPSSILMAHQWHASSIYRVSLDSVNNIRDSVTYTPDSCTLSTVFSFLPNGALVITDSCVSASPLNGNWNINASGLFAGACANAPGNNDFYCGVNKLFVGIFSYSLSEINADHFKVQNTTFLTADYPDSIVTIKTITTTTYKSIN